MSEIRKGARVRVTYEGVVSMDDSARYFSESGFRGSVRTANGHAHQIWDGETVEVIEPALEDKAVYLHPNGIPYQYDKARDCFYTPGIKGRVEITTTRDQLIKLIPETP